jgi:cytochrome c oxidase subunit 3
MTDHAIAHEHALEPPSATGIPHDKMGMWVFLCSEVMFFTGLIGSYIVLRFASPSWPHPGDTLNIWLTALNTFILICSSVTMVLALAAIQQGKKAKCSAYLLATVFIGSVFLGVQVYEYYQLMFGHHYPPGISATGHFRPDVSLFASCFFAMTGFHGLHVTAGVVTLLLVFLQSLTGKYNAANYATIEYAGLYWHFVDLVWIILFTIVYLV